MKTFFVFLASLIAFANIATSFSPTIASNKFLHPNNVNTSPNVIEKTQSVRPANSVKVFFFGQPKDDGSPGDYVCKVGEAISYRYNMFKKYLFMPCFFYKLDSFVNRKKIIALLNVFLFYIPEQ